jgi:2-iminobutanoate/2-iminopropanoate deaminase
MAMDKAAVGPSNELTAGSPSAIRAGDFVFLSGLSAPDIDADPLRFRPQEQTAEIFNQMQATLDEAGSSMDRVVKLQTFHGDLDELPSHLAARTRAFSPPLPPSTAVEASLAHPNADVTINDVAVVNDAFSEAIEVESVPRPLGPYSQAVNAPPFVFLALPTG